MFLSLEVKKANLHKKSFFFTQLKMASLSNLAEFPQVVVVVLPA